MRSVLIISDKPPFGTNNTNEAIRLGAGFAALGEDIDCSLILLGDAVYFMLNNLDNKPIGADPITEGLEMADLSELTIIMTEEDLKERKIETNMLTEYENLKIIPKGELAAIIEKFEMVLKV